MFLALCNFVAVLISALLAFFTKRLTHQQMGEYAIPWVNHWGNWCDLTIMTIICLLIWPYLRQVPLSSLNGIFVISLTITVACHILWAWLQTIPGTIVDPTVTLRLPLTGLLHVLYMTLLLTCILAFFLKCPGAPRFWVCASLTAFIIPGIMQPGWYVYKISEGVGRVGLASWLISAAMFILIWAVGFTRP